MAAKIKLCRYLSKTFCNFAILTLLGLLSSNLLVESATTQPPTNAPNTTVAATTQPATTTQAVTTTTLPATTTTVPSGPQTVIGETAIGQCLCDLTGNKCDINCCCDEDCTEEDKTAFICDLTAVTVDGKSCFPESIFLFANSPAKTTTNNGLFCIYYDNYKDSYVDVKSLHKERNFYLDPDFILDIPSFNQYSYQYGRASNPQPVTVEEPVYTLDSYYKSGDPVYVVYPNEAVGTFILPTSSVSNQCNDQNAISYLQEVNTECSRIIPTLTTTTCQDTAAFKAASFYSGFRVVKTSGLFGYVVNGTFIDITTPAPPTQVPVTTAATTDNNTAQSTTAAPVTTPAVTTPPPTVNVSLVQDLYNNPYTVAIDTTTLPHLCVQPDGSLAACNFAPGTIPDPTFVPGTTTCQNVVQEVRYFMTTDGTNGINQVQAQFVFKDITTTDLPITQRYSVSYDSVTDSNDTFTRSGNPGYVIGKPVLYGTLNVTTAVIDLPTDPSQGFTIVRASGTGDCSTVSRTPIKFGENMRSGCVVRLNLASISNNSQICPTIQTQILDALEGPNSPPDNNRYVATFGNTVTSKIGDWVRIITDKRPRDTQTDSTSCWLSMGVHIQVLYANVGALANPQPKIIGVAYLYDSVKDVNFQCTGAFCQDANSNLEQAFEVSQTVSFIDVSQPATKFAGEAPIFIAKVPTDFFYPFLYYTNRASSHFSAGSVLLMACASLLTFLINCKYSAS